MSPFRLFALVSVVVAGAVAVLHCGSDANTTSTAADAGAADAGLLGDAAGGGALTDTTSAPAPILPVSCGPACADAGGQCVDDGGTCSFSCTGAGGCPAIVCPEGMRCSVFCNGAGVCDHVDCSRGSFCDLSCNGAGSCDNVTCATGTSCSFFCNGGCDHVCCADGPCTFDSVPRATCP